MRDFGSALRHVVECGSVAIMDTAAYHDIFNRPVGRLPRDSVYGSCFEFSAARILQQISAKSGDRVSFVLESGSPNAGNARVIFDRLKAIASKFGWSIGDITFADKQEFGAVQAADIIAYNARENVDKAYTNEPVSDLYNQALAQSGTRVFVDVFNRSRLVELRSVLETARDEWLALGARKPKEIPPQTLQWSAD